MRKIKFRAWDRDDKKMLEVKAIDWNDKGDIVSINYPDGKLYPDENYGDHIDLMQFTGVYDKNEKEIYEGDVVFANSKYEGKFFGIVEFENGRFQILDNGDFIYYDWEEYEIEVIGSVYEVGMKLVNEYEK